MKKVVLAGMSAVAALAAVAEATVSTSGTELTIDVPAGESYTFTQAVASSLTKIVKTGTGSCEFAPSSITFTGTMDIQAGTMHGDRVKFGAPGTWKVTPGAALRFDLVSSGYSGGENGNPTGKLEIGGMGCDGYPAYYFKMLPNGTAAGQYSTSHANFNGGVKLTADTSVGGGRFGFATMDMQGYDLYTYCTNGQAQFETYYNVSNPGDLHVKAGQVLLERTSKFTTDLNGHGYVLANGTTLRMYNFPNTPTTHQMSLPCVRLENGASATITCTGGGAINSNYNTWFGDWYLTNGVRLTVNPDALTHPGSMAGSIYGAEIYKSGSGQYTITSNGVHRMANVTVAIGRLTLQANSDGSAHRITNIWVVSGSEYGSAVSRLDLDGARTDFDPATGISANGIRVGYSTSSGARYGVLTIGDGAVVSNNFLIGCDSSNGKTTVGAVYMDDATVYWKAGAGNDGFLGQNSYGYGYWCQNAGTFTHKGYVNLGAVGHGCMDQRGGVHKITDSAPLKFARTGGNSWGCYHQTGGTFEGQVAWFNYNYVTNNSAAQAVLTTTGPNSVFSCDSMQVFMSINNVDTFINVNDGATLKGRLFREISFSGYKVNPDWSNMAPTMTNTTHVYVNLNGGIIKNKSTLSADIWGASRLRGPSRAVVYEKGVTFDTTEKDIELYSPLEKPFGKGVKSIAVPQNTITNFNKFIASPRVKLTSATGTGATAYAVFNEKTRQVERIDVTGPGCGYEDLTVKIEKENAIGGYYDVDAANIVLETLSTTGAVRKAGTGTLTLKCANTYGGATRVEGGTIAFTDAAGLPEGSALEFAAAAVAGGDKTKELLSAVNYNGGEIRVTEAETLDRDTFGKSRVLAKFTNAPAALPDFRLVNSDGTTAPSGGWKIFFAADRKTIMFGRNIGTVVIAR